MVYLILKGTEKLKGCMPHHQTPIIPELLLLIKCGCNLCAKDAVFCAAFLVLFFGLLQKSNLVQDSEQLDPKRQLTRDSLASDQQSVTLTVCWTKTIYHRKKTRLGQI